MKYTLKASNSCIGERLLSNLNPENEKSYLEHLLFNGARNDFNLVQASKQTSNID